MLMGLLYNLGKLYFVLLCYIFLNDYESGNWRELILFNSLPVFLCFAGTVFLISESPRFILAHGRYSEAFSAINSAIQTNEGQHLITTEEV
jgi:hypothetical protein